MRPFAAVDIETSGLDPNVHRILEVAVVSDRGNVQFSLPFDPMKDAFEQKALEVNGWSFREFAPLVDPNSALELLDELLVDAHLVGKNPQFDASFLAELYAKHRVDCPPPPWHHRLVDVGSLAWGWYCAHAKHHKLSKWPQPPNVSQVEEWTGVARDLDAEYHTAAMDAEWAWRVFRTIVPA